MYLQGYSDCLDLSTPPHLHLPLRRGYCPQSHGNPQNEREKTVGRADRGWSYGRYVREGQEFFLDLLPDSSSEKPEAIVRANRHNKQEYSARREDKRDRKSPLVRRLTDRLSLEGVKSTIEKTDLGSSWLCSRGQA